MDKKDVQGSSCLRVSSTSLISDATSSVPLSSLASHYKRPQASTRLFALILQIKHRLILGAAGLMVQLLVSALIVANLLSTVAMGRPFQEAVGVQEKLALVAADSPISSFSAMEGKMDRASAPGDLRHHDHHHRRLDNSIAGAEVILGALAATVIVAVICYIRVTRKRIEDEKV
ncbi:hypothetical protein ZIOFF_067099 [Zingiber officinale]|uniref:Uncharacterized protein n=1 Tax=Zingiber officinale TaxID=94328 RepID=A0A8J5C5V3_ZINOF|nr:hypothetical protein ZIOFF_067099 [Zingiber officinale]